LAHLVQFKRHVFTSCLGDCGGLGPLHPPLATPLVAAAHSSAGNATSSPEERSAPPTTNSIH